MRPRLNNKYIKQGGKPINGSGLVFSKEMCELTINQVWPEDLDLCRFHIIIYDSVNSRTIYILR